MCDTSTEASGTSGLVFFGVALSAFATIAGNAGLNMQKWGFMLESEKPASERKHFALLGRWWAGFALVLGGSILDLVSYGMAPSSIVTPVGSLTLVVNIGLAHWWLGEKVYRQDWIGSFLIITGATLTVIFGNQQETCLTVEELTALYGTESMLIYMIGVGVIVLVSFAYQYRAEQVLKRYVKTYKAGKEQPGVVEIELSSSPSVQNSGRDDSTIAIAMEPNSSPGPPTTSGDATTTLAVKQASNPDEKSTPRASAAAPSLAQPASSATPETTSSSSSSSHHGIKRSRPDLEPISAPAKAPVAVSAATSHGGASSAAAAVDDDTPAKLGAGVGAGEAAVQTPSGATPGRHIVNPPSAYEAYARFHPVCVSVLAGTLGAQTVLFAKSVAEAVKTSLAGSPQFDQPWPYVFAAATIGFIVVQQNWLAHALRFFDASFVVPVFQGTFITVSVLGGVFYFQELEGQSILNLIMFPIAVLIVLSGVYVLSTRKMGGMRAQLMQDADDDMHRSSSPGTYSPTTTSSPSPTTGSAMHVTVVTGSPQSHLHDVALPGKASSAPQPFVGPLHSPGEQHSSLAACAHSRPSPSQHARPGLGVSLTSPAAYGAATSAATSASSPSLQRSRRLVRRRASAMAALPPSALQDIDRVPAPDGRLPVMTAEQADTTSLRLKPVVLQGDVGKPARIASWHEVVTPRATDLRPGAGRVEPQAVATAFTAGAARATVSSTRASAAAAATGGSDNPSPGVLSMRHRSRRGTDGPMQPRGALRVDWFVAAAGARTEQLAGTDAEIVVRRLRPMKHDTYDSAGRAAGRAADGRITTGAVMSAKSAPDGALPTTPTVGDDDDDDVSTRYAYRHGHLGRADAVQPEHHSADAAEPASATALPGMTSPAQTPSPLRDTDYDGAAARGSARM